MSGLRGAPPDSGEQEAKQRIQCLQQARVDVCRVQGEAPRARRMLRMPDEEGPKRVRALLQALLEKQGQVALLAMPISSLLPLPQITAHALGTRQGKGRVHLREVQ